MNWSKYTKRLTCLILYGKSINDYSLLCTFLNLFNFKTITRVKGLYASCCLKMRLILSTQNDTTKVTTRFFYPEEFLDSYPIDNRQNLNPRSIAPRSIIRPFSSQWQITSPYSSGIEVQWCNGRLGKGHWKTIPLILKIFILIQKKIKGKERKD